MDNNDINNTSDGSVVTGFEIVDNASKGDGWHQVQRRTRTPNSKATELNKIATRPCIARINPSLSTTGVTRVAPLAPLVSHNGTGKLSNNCYPTTSLLVNRRASCEQSPQHSPTHTPRDAKDGRQYYRLREVSDVVGFVVNVHDATNFDIDLQLPADAQRKYCTVIKNQYSYKDLGNDYITNPASVMTETITPEVGITYRCRLRGIGINQLPTSTHMWKSHIMTMEVKQLIDRSDGWISCTLSDVDVYQRLLVDVCVHTSDGCIDIKDYLLGKMRECPRGETPVFYPYNREKSVKTQ